MSKTNFTKVEEALKEGLLRMNISGLLDMASAASKIGSQPSETAFTQRELLAALKFEVNYCKNEELFSIGGLSRSVLKKMLKEPNDLKPEEWEQLKLFQEKACAYRKKMIETQPAGEDDKLIETQRKRHINKRYNTKEQWLPLQ